MCHIGNGYYYYVLGLFTRVPLSLYLYLPPLQLTYILLISRQGKTRLAKWYDSFQSKEKARIMKEVALMVLARPSKMCNFIEWRDKKLVYKRYASLYFVACIDKDDNELITLEQIHLFVEVLDSYFGNVCELDIIFNFHKVQEQS